MVNEIKNTVYAKDIRVVSLASRQQLCVNPEVRKLKSNALINERCLELKSGKAKGKCCQQATQQDENGQAAKKSKVVKTTAQRCPFSGQTAVETLAAVAVGSEAIIDIEELIQVGKDEEACPYYAARQAAADAQVSDHLDFGSRLEE